MILQPKNWDRFQHYKDRCPPWIKLHRDILTNRDFARLPLASKALAPLLWLLASESKDGRFEACTEELEFRLHIKARDIEEGLKPLIDKGFFVVASGVLALCEQLAIPERETERETEKEVEREAEPARRRRQQLPSDFSPDDTGLNAARQRGVSVPEELEKFRNYHLAKGSVMLDWQAAWRTWVGRAQPAQSRGKQLDPSWAAYYSRSNVIDTEAKVVE